MESSLVAAIFIGLTAVVHADETYRCSKDPSDECIFPFEHDGVTYNECAPRTFSGYWCYSRINWQNCKVCEDDNPTTAPNTTESQESSITATTTTIIPRTASSSMKSSLASEVIKSDDTEFSASVTTQSMPPLTASISTMYSRMTNTTATTSTTTTSSNPVYKCSMKEGTPCAFPFEYEGKTYNECITAGWVGKPWCNTKDARTTWVYCKICEDSTTGSSSTTITTTTNPEISSMKPTSSSTTRSTSTSSTTTSTTTRKSSAATPNLTPLTKPITASEMTASAVPPKIIEPRGHNPDQSQAGKAKSSEDDTEDSSGDEESNKPNTVMTVVLVLCVLVGIIAIVIVALFVRRKRRKRPSNSGIEDGSSGDSLLNHNGNGSNKSVSPDGSQEMQPLNPNSEDKSAAGDHVVVNGGKDSRSDIEISVTA